MIRETNFTKLMQVCVDIVKKTHRAGRYENYYFGTLAHDLVVYKKVWRKSLTPAAFSWDVIGVIAQLEIPAGCIIGFGDHDKKCRTSEARVLALYNNKTPYGSVEEAFSSYDRSFKYAPGETVTARLGKTPDQCASGIHFFIDIETARRW